MQIPKQLLEWMNAQEKINKELLGMIQCKESTSTFFPAVADPMPKKWKGSDWVVEHHDTSIKEVDFSKLSLYISPQQRHGKIIMGHYLHNEIKKEKVPVLNACILDYLLLHPELIPEDWKQGAWGKIPRVYFWGTVYRDLVGDLYVRHLCWHGGACRWSYDWLDRYWCDQSPAAVLKQ